MTQRFIVEVSQDMHTAEYIAKCLRETLEKIPAISSATVSIISQHYLKVNERFQKIVPGAE